MQNAPASNYLQKGQAALARGAWDEAFRHFEAGMQYETTPELLEGLGMAAWWLDNARLTFHAREQAYRLYRQRADYASAARMAIYLGFDYYSFRGDFAVTNGWLQRAHRLLESVEVGPEQALLAIYEGYLALMVHNDIATARQLGTQAAQIARQLEIIDLEMLALALEGLALVTSGEVVEGMRRLDESTTAAMAGEISDLDAQAQVCCYLIFACEKVRDFDRAAQWCVYMKEVTTRWHYPMMFSYCRMHYAGVLIWRGEWAEAEATLVAATNELFATRPIEATEGIVRLADLRRLQGNYEEAAALLAQAETLPFRLVGEHLAPVVRAWLTFDQGDTLAAIALAERFLQRTPPEDRAGRPAALELLVVAYLAQGDLNQAQAVQNELDAIARHVATEPLQAAARLASGLVAAVEGDHQSACHHLESAIGLYRRCGAPLETARARVEVARSMLALGETQSASVQAQQAFDTLQQLGAQPASRRAAALLEEIEDRRSSSVRAPATVGVRADDLTPRELDVLHLIAAGKSNQEIAAELVLSIRTVERHISNIYQKLHLSGPVARAAATAYLLRHR